MLIHCLIKLFVFITFSTLVQNLPVQEESNVNKIHVVEKVVKTVSASDGLVTVSSNLEQKNEIDQKDENVAENEVTEAVKVTAEHKHTPPPECHGERKEVDPAAAEEYKAKKHTRPTLAKQTTTTVVKTTTTTSPAPTGPTKKSTKRHGVKFDENGDSVWVDDSNDSPDSSDVRAQKKQGQLDKDGNMIDTENQASGERDEESEDDSQESDGIPLITIPLVDILNKYARMMGGKRASNSRYEYSYEDENEIKIKEIKDRILDEADQEDDDDKDVVDL